MRKLGGEKSLKAAIGSTIYSDPVVKQAVERVRSGNLSPQDFSRLYSGNVRAGYLRAKVKHGPGHGFDDNISAMNFLRTLTE